MTGIEAEKLAEAHVDWFLEAVRSLMVMNFVHGTIAEMFNVSPSTMQRRKEELQKAGVIFYMNVGQPKTKVVCAFPSVVKAWICKKSSKGEFF